MKEVTKAKASTDRRFYLPHTELAQLAGVEGCSVTEINPQRTGLFFTVTSKPVEHRPLVKQYDLEAGDLKIVIGDLTVEVSQGVNWR